MHPILISLLAMMTFVIPVTSHSAPAADAVTAPGTKTVLRGGWRFDPLTGEMRRNTGIVVLNGQFFEVDADLRERDLAGTQIIELAEDEYALPGLIDMHGHYDVMLMSQRRIDELVVNPIVYLANGVTSTFTAGEYNPEAVREARLRIDRGEQTGPRIFQAGPKFGVASPRWREDATADDVRALVDQWTELGVKGFKAYGLNRAQLQVLIQRAHQHGLPVTGHLMGRDDINPKEAILMGIDRIEHYPGGDGFAADKVAYESLHTIDPASAAFQEVAGLFLRHRVYYNPTLTRMSFLGRGPRDVAEILPYWADEQAFFTPFIQQKSRNRQTGPRPDPWPHIPEALRQALKAFYDMGGNDLITLGTDNPSTGDYLPGFDAHRELHNFVLAGIPAAAALKFATINGARALNMGERLGSIDTGKWADLFVVRGNPLEDIRRTRTIRLVMKAGQVYDPAALLQSVQGKLGPANAEEAKDW